MLAILGWSACVILFSVVLILGLMGIYGSILADDGGSKVGVFVLTTIGVFGLWHFLTNLPFML